MGGGRETNFILPEAPGDSYSYTKVSHERHVYKEESCRASGLLVGEDSEYEYESLMAS